MSGVGRQERGPALKVEHVPASDPEIIIKCPTGRSAPHEPPIDHLDNARGARRAKQGVVAGAGVLGTQTTFFLISFYLESATTWKHLSPI